MFTKNRRWPKLVVPAIVLFVVFGLYGFWYEPASLRAADHVIELDEANRIVQRPLRIAVISDLHAGAPYIGEDKIERVVALANGPKPDLILLAGDYVINGVIGGTPMPIETIVAHLKRLSAPLGVFAVLGNNERRIDPGRFVRAFEANDIPVLDDKSVMLKRDGQALYIAGISDFTSGPHDIGAALANVPPSAHAICVTHSPDIFPLLPSTCALTIAGHTHGGQVFLPLIGRPVVPSDYGQRYAAGLVHENGKYLFVSTGIGTSIIPLRFAVPPEISILDIP
jgi:predicted MPP superfamily phosphohydrolase